MWTAEYRALLKALTWWLIANEISRAYEPPMPSDPRISNGMADA